MSPNDFLDVATVQYSENAKIQTGYSFFFFKVTPNIYVFNIMI